MGNKNRFVRRYLPDDGTTLLSYEAKRFARHWLYGKPTRYVIFDLETTGLSPSLARIIEIGAVAIETGCIIEEFQTLIDAGVNIPGAVRRINRITDKMLKGQPKIEEVIPHFREFMADSILIAHNAAFDIGFLKHEFYRQSLHMPNNSYFCTMNIFKNACPQVKYRKLETVARYLLGDSFTEVQLHRALDDARLLTRVWFKLEAAIKANSDLRYLLVPRTI